VVLLFKSIAISLIFHFIARGNLWSNGREDSFLLLVVIFGDFYAILKCTLLAKKLELYS
jgi:hypothetical protein